MTKENEIKIFGTPIYLYRRLSPYEHISIGCWRPAIWKEGAYFSRLKKEYQHFYEGDRYPAYKYKDNIYVVDGNNLEIVLGEVSHLNISPRESSKELDIIEVIRELLVHINKIEDKLF